MRVHAHDFTYIRHWCDNNLCIIVKCTCMYFNYSGMTYCRDFQSQLQTHFEDPLKELKVHDNELHYEYACSRLYSQIFI